MIYLVLMLLFQSSFDVNYTWQTWQYFMQMDVELTQQTHDSKRGFHKFNNAMGIESIFARTIKARILEYSFVLT